MISHRFTTCISALMVVTHGHLRMESDTSDQMHKAAEITYVASDSHTITRNQSGTTPGRCKERGEMVGKLGPSLQKLVDESKLGRTWQKLAKTFNHDGRNFCQITPQSCDFLDRMSSQEDAKRILEIGAFCGCSTACIASGINQSHSTRTFDSADFFFSSLEDFVGYFHGKPSSVPLWVLEHGGFEKYYQRHLDELGLSRYVKPWKGDFLHTLDPKAGKYDLIYLDVTHSVQEIHRNLPHVIANFAKNGTVIVMDDVSGKVKEVEAVLAIASCSEAATIGEMYVCVVCKDS